MWSSSRCESREILKSLKTLIFSISMYDIHIYIYVDIYLTLVTSMVICQPETMASSLQDLASHLLPDFLANEWRSDTCDVDPSAPGSPEGSRISSDLRPCAALEGRERTPSPLRRMDWAENFVGVRRREAPHLGSKGLVTVWAVFSRACSKDTAL